MTSPNAILMIVKGVAKTPQDSTSAEQGLDSIDLLDPLGFSCDDYAIQLPNLKNGAVWADSPITDGRTLVSGAMGNVTETIRLNLTAGTLVQMAAMLSKLSRFQHDCNDFWDTFGQIEPVYLKHQIEGEPGPRYALLYNIEINLEQPLDPGDPSRTVTLSIEREYGWRGIAPGGNPKQWNCYINRIPFNTSNANLRSGTQHTAIGATANKQEFNTIYTLQSQNFVDIPAALIPGDLPALVCAAIIPTSSAAGLLTNVMLAKSTKPTSLTDREGHILPLYNSFAGAAASLGTDASFVADATLGIRHLPVSATARYVSVSFATATDQKRLEWIASTTFAHLSPQILRGRYQIFLRGEQNAGALGNISLYLKLISGGNAVVTPTINPKITVANTVQLNYLGIVTFPLTNNSYSAVAGTGVSVSDVYNVAGQVDGNLLIQLFALRSTGAATLRVYDLIFVPIDEGVAYVLPIGGASGGPESIIYDNTGYFTHGKTDSFAAGRLDDGSGGLDNEVIAEIRGGLTLTPKVNNRVYIMVDQLASPIGSNPSDTVASFFNIVPRWAGLRDV